MGYYKIDIKRSFPNDMVATNAEGEKIPNAEDYFYQMDRGEEISSPPLFDYFYLKSFDQKEYWEWMLSDVYDFIGEGSQIPGWLISEKLKNVFDRFNLVEPHFMYNSKLMFKGEKLDYFIFHFRGKVLTDFIREKMSFSKSIFANPITNEIFRVDNKNDFVTKKKACLIAYDSKIEIKQIVLKEDIDFFPMQSFLVDNLVSKRLKEAIEQEGITGFEFTELDYEVIIDRE